MLNNVPRAEKQTDTSDLLSHRCGQRGFAQGLKRLTDTTVSPLPRPRPKPLPLLKTRKTKLPPTSRPRPSLKLLPRPRPMPPPPRRRIERTRIGFLFWCGSHASEYDTGGRFGKGALMRRPVWYEVGGSPFNDAQRDFASSSPGQTWILVLWRYSDLPDPIVRSGFLSLCTCMDRGQTRPHAAYSTSSIGQWFVQAYKYMLDVSVRLLHASLRVRNPLTPSLARSRDGLS